MSDFEPKQFGKYLLLSRIAVGGMAEIYRAKTYGVDGFEKELVIKRILPHCSADKDFITMLVDEAKLSVMLSHANIVQVYDLSKVGDDYYIAMEYIHGVNLRDVMYSCREMGMPVPPDIAVYIASEICKGLDYAHRKTHPEDNSPLNIVHRDISPQNILVSYEGEVKIVDFGIAKAAMNISHTLAGILKGKIAYMSPEQAMGKTVDSRTDIFSTGILLYEMLTGTKLFTGESQFEVLKKIRTTKIGIGSLPDTVPELLKPIVVKALAYDADERYAHAGDLQIELTKYLYSKHVDFSPRKLASFIRELFADNIKDEQVVKAREAAAEGLTSTMNVQEGAKQVSIVHREEEEVSLEAETDSTGKPKEAAFETMVTPVEEAAPPAEEEATPVRAAPPPPPVAKVRPAAVPKKKKTLRNAIAAMLVLAAAAYGLYRYVPAVRFWEKPAEEVPPVLVGSVNITSTPEGAKVFLEGEDTNKVTPAVIGELDADKSYKVKLEKDEFEPAEGTVTIKAGEQVALALTLSPATGTLNIITDPEGASIMIDGKLTGNTTPAAIEKLKLNTDLRLTLSKPEYEDFEQVVNLKTSKPQKISTKLTSIKPQMGTLVVKSTPSGAQVLLDGKDTGRTTPAQLANLAPKKYEVTLRMKGYDDWSKSFDVAANKSIPVEGDLTSIKEPTAKEPITEKPITTEEPEKVPEEKPTPKVASLKVTSNPSGARISLDGKSTGKKTPTTLGDLKVGSTYRVGVSKDGYQPKSVKRTLKDETTSLAFNLIKKEEPKVKPPTEKPIKEPTITPTVETGKPGKIKVTSSPSGADVFINDSYKGKTPLTVSVSPGTARVLISKQGLSRVSRTVTVKPGKTVKLSNIRLGDLYGEVSLSSEPPAAQVIFDGQAIPARTPVTIRKVRTDRRHTVTIQMPGYKPWTRSFSMEGGSASFHAPLKPQ